MEAKNLEGDLLHGRWFSLVPLNQRHHQQLYDLAYRDQNNFRWRFRGTQPSYATFEQGLFAGVICQFVVCPNDSPDRVAGMVIAYNGSSQDDFCYLAAISDKTFGPGTVEGIALFLRYLLRYWPFRKVYLESLEFNVPQYASAVKVGIMKEEGRLKDHHYFDGRYWDMVIYAIYREDAIQYADARPLFLPEPDAPAASA